MVEQYDEIVYDTTVEVIGYDDVKPDMLIWRCTAEQAKDISKIAEMVKNQGYEYFELQYISKSHKLYSIE